MASNLLHWLNRTVDRLFGFELTAEEWRQLDELPSAPADPSSQPPPGPIPPQPVPRPAAH